MPQNGGQRQPVRYEARATVMFGAYAVWAAYADGTAEPVAHGAPMHCVAMADRLNREIAVAAGDASAGGSGVNIDAPTTT